MANVSRGLQGLSSEERKKRPIFSGVIMYFPDALAEVAYVSYIGNQQHNPGQPLHWAKEKSSDETDAEVRHMIDSITEVFDTDGVRHKAKKAWRALADLQREIDAENKAAAEMCAMTKETRAL